MAESLALELFDLLAVRRQEAMANGWPELPEWVFCSEAGTAPEPGNVDRVWRRVRRRAAKEGVRPLKLHCARHTWATMALHAGKSEGWVADQLGHSDPALTLRVYAHAMPEDETDLSFADFDTPKRPYTAPVDEGPSTESRNYLERMARREGLAGELCSPSASRPSRAWRLANPRPSGSKYHASTRSDADLR
jgi:hypothetical protein